MEVYPSEVFEAIEYAKSIDPQDIHGDKAFQINVKKQRMAKQDTCYMDFKILKKHVSRDGSVEWKFIPLMLKVINIPTTAHIRPKESKNNFPGVRVQFTEITSFVRQTQQNGATIDVQENFGQAIISIYAAFKRLASAALQDGSIIHEKTDIKSIIQTHFRTEDWKTSRKKDKCVEAIIRIELPFEGETVNNVKIIKQDALPKCNIYDATKRMKNAPRNMIPFEHATWNKKPINYTTINDFIPCGSLCSGTIDMNSVCLSAQGVSLPSKFNAIIVKRVANSRKSDLAKTFSSDEFSQIAGPDEVSQEDDQENNEHDGTGSDDPPSDEKKIDEVIDKNSFDLSTFDKDDDE